MKKMGPPKRTAIWSDLLLCLCFLSDFVQGGKVPGLYVFGDSQLDVGNNNYLQTPMRAKANFPHNGVDYPGHLATGRFSNGKNLADFIAGSLSVPTPPAYRSIGSTTGNSSIFLSGVNFASGGAGVFKLTNKGLTISFDEQIKRDYTIVYAGLVQQLGKTQASTHMEGSIFAIGVGGNDIASRISLDDGRTPTNVQQLLTSSASVSDQQFVDSLVHSLKRQLQRLYELGIRKLFFVGTGPLGCYPSLRQQSATKECIAEANSLSMQYNTAVQNLLRKMSTRNPDFLYSFLDQYAVLEQYINEPQANGFAEVEEACCALGDNMPICTPESQLCSNRTNHIFWDGAHLTEVTTQKLMGVAFNGSAPLVTPLNLRQLSSIGLRVNTAGYSSKFEAARRSI